VIESGDKSRRISEMITADYIVRNDEVVGSIPTSSTIFSITYSAANDLFCPILSQKSSLRGVCISTGAKRALKDGRGKSEQGRVYDRCRL
jgi:hypothetical protein